MQNNAAGEGTLPMRQKSSNTDLMKARVVAAELRVPCIPFQRAIFTYTHTHTLRAGKPVGTKRGARRQ